MSNEENRPMPTVDAVKRIEAEKNLAALQEKIANGEIEPQTQKWEPNGKTPLVAAIAIGVLGSLAPVALALTPIPWLNVVLAVTFGGVATGLATYYGIKSNGAKTSPSNSNP